MVDENMWKYNGKAEMKQNDMIWKHVIIKKCENIRNKIE